VRNVQNKKWKAGETLKSALLSRCGKYRFELSRMWAPEKPPFLFIMLNPSTADANEDDPTITRCINFVKSFGGGSLQVVNLFAFRATNPKELLKAEDPIGEWGDTYILEQAELTLERGGKIICAWGTGGVLNGRDQEVKELLKDYPLYALAVTKGGHPNHPLYLKADRKPITFRRRGRV